MLRMWSPKPKISAMNAMPHLFQFLLYMLLMCRPTRDTEIISFSLPHCPCASICFSVRPISRKIVPLFLILFSLYIFCIFVAVKNVNQLRRSFYIVNCERVVSIESWKLYKNFLRRKLNQIMHVSSSISFLNEYTYHQYHDNHSLFMDHGCEQLQFMFVMKRPTAWILYIKNAWIKMTDYYLSNCIVEKKECRNRKEMWILGQCKW